MKALRIIGFLVMATPAFGQIRFDAGASTFSGLAVGGGIVSYQENSTVGFNTSYFHHHMIFGAYDRFAFRGYDVTAGTQSVGFSFDSAGVSGNLLGLSVKRNFDDGRTHVAAFAGAIGLGYSVPWAFTVVPQHVGGGVLLQHKLAAHDLTLSSLDALQASKVTSMQGATYQWRTYLRASGAAGLLDNQRTVNGTVFGQYSGVFGYVNRSSYYTPIDVTYNSAGVGYRKDFFNIVVARSVGLRTGHDTVGENATIGLTFSRLHVDSGVYRMVSPIPATAVQTTFTEKLTRRLSVSESIYQHGGRTSYAFGGGWNGRRVQFGLTHSMAFVATGFQQITVAQVSLRIHDTQIGGSTITDSLGKTQWQTGTQTYTQVRIPFLGDVKQQTVQHHGSSGKFAFIGKCVEESGEVVVGCYVQIGKDVAFTGDRGTFVIRTSKNAAATMTVDAAQFDSGNWQIVSAPVEVRPGEEITIVVRRM